MNDTDDTSPGFPSPVLGFWQRIPVLLRAILSGIFVQSIGVGVWVLSLSVIPAPWYIVFMAVILWLYWMYFAGSGWPGSTAEARRARFRAVKLSSGVRKASLAGVILFLVVLQSAAVLTFKLTEFPAEATADYGLGGLPVWQAWGAILMASLVAGICEETGFRGYMQAPLEERYGPVAAIALTSLMFTVLHLHQAWAQPVLLQIFVISVMLGILAYTSGSLIPGMVAHTIMDISNFSLWWTDLVGHIEFQTIAVTGVDALFIVAGLVFAVSFVLFFLAARKILVARLSLNISGK